VKDYGLDQRKKTLKSNHPWMENDRKVGTGESGRLLAREKLRRV